MASFATHASRNYPLELDCARERIAQLEDEAEQAKAAIDFIGRQRDSAEAAVVEADERVARREAEVRKAEAKVEEVRRHHAKVSNSSLRAEEELRRLRGAIRHQDRPGQRGSMSTAESSRIGVDRLATQKSSSSVRPASKDRHLERGKEVVGQACQAAFCAGYEQCLRRLKTSSASYSSKVKIGVQDEVQKSIIARFLGHFAETEKTSAQDEVLRSVVAEFLSQFAKTFCPDLESRKK